MKKVLTIVWTRPELIRLSEIIKKLDIFTDHIFVHTGQNFTVSLHDQFFSDLDLRLPNYQLNIENPKIGMDFIWYMLVEIDKILEKEKPSVVLILGDTNSALSAYVCKKRGIPVFHMEAWNRCYDEVVPEEMNRKIVDSLSAYLLPYTQRSRENLLAEWYHPSKIIVTGNPISEIISKYAPKEKDKSLNDFILVTLHRTENVTNPEVLRGIIDALNELSKDTKIILSVHPKLKEMLAKFQIQLSWNIDAQEPLGFLEFIWMEKNALCVLTDSGTVPEECAILWTPCILIRDSTERPELLETNSMILSGTRKESIIEAFRAAKDLSVGRIPDDYRDIDISDKIVKLLLRT